MSLQEGVQFASAFAQNEPNQFRCRALPQQNRQTVTLTGAPFEEARCNPALCVQGRQQCCMERVVDGFNTLKVTFSRQVANGLTFLVVVLLVSGSRNR
jgi:hypothetical protein